LIVAHINPDPDTLGSCLGLKQILNKLGKTAYIVCDTKVSEKICGYFDVAPELDTAYAEAPGFEPGCMICVDAAAVSQIGKFEKYYSDDVSKNKIDLVIDHHYINSFYGRENYVDNKAAATGEIIFDLAKELDFEIDRNFAKNIYCAIICDSGSFRYSATTVKTMTAAAELMSTGFDFAKLNRLIYQNKSLTQVATERLAYNSLNLCCDGKIAFVTITREMKKAAGLEGIELDGINEIPKMIQGVEVGVTIKEVDPMEDGECLPANTKAFRISLRSNEYVNVADIAADFGGGGHIRAAGCKYESGVDFDVALLEKELIKKIKNVL